MNSIFDIINIPIGWILRFCNMLIPNYMVALLLFALIMQIVLLPFAIKQQKNSIKQASLAPKLAAIRKKYAGRNDKATQQRMQQETMELYQREHASPAGGCLPLLIQMPILFSLFHVITNPLTYLTNFGEAVKGFTVTIGEKAATLAEHFAGGYQEINIIKHLQETPSTVELLQKNVEGFSADALPNFTMFGGTIDLSQSPMDAVAVNGSMFTWMMIIPVVTVVALLVSQVLTRKFTYQAPEAAEAQNNCSMKVMLYAMPLLSGYFAYMYAAAIGIYWIFRNVLSFVQQIILAKLMPVPKFSEEDYKAAEKELLGSNRAKKTSKYAENSGPRPGVRSLHYIDADDDETDESSNAASSSQEKQSADTKPLGVSDSTLKAPIKDDKDTKYKDK